MHYDMYPCVHMSVQQALRMCLHIWLYACHREHRTERDMLTHDVQLEARSSAGRSTKYIPRDIVARPAPVARAAGSTRIMQLHV